MKTCSICGYALRDEEGRHTSRSKTSNMILLMSLSLAGQKDSESARPLAESITKPNRKVCHTHVIRAVNVVSHDVAEDAAKAPIIGEVDGEGSDLKSAKEAERSLDTSEDESKCSSTSSSFFKPLLRTTKPETLDRYFLVKGFQLMQLFQFCPQCGHRLSETELVGKGTAAIVKYVCKGCNFGAQCVKQWESQELQSPT
ncbi:hypothetical protein OSTOST_16305 [Ostertagia ostertagi]